MKKASKIILYLVCVFTVLFLLYYLIFFRPFIKKMQNTSKPKTAELQTYRHADLSVIKQVGNLAADKKSSFPNFDLNKPEGVIRIGCFGDSFTYGSEVDSSHDFPSLLDNLLKENGFSNVEVINFGSPWHGFHQAFILWTEIGKKMGCDYILLGPSGFHPSRETSFNHTNWTSPYYLHSRFIFAGDNLELIHVKGEIHKERFSDYFSLFPKKRYLQYDRNTPVFLQCLLPKGRTLKNSFYYSKKTEYEEAAELYRKLLPLMADNSTNILIGHYYQNIVDLAQELNIPNISSFKMDSIYPFPYQAPGGHNSSFGNQLVAEQFLFWLSGETQGSHSIIVTKDLLEPIDMHILKKKYPLSYFTSIKIGFDNKSIGHFLNAFNSPNAGQGSPTMFNGTDVVSLLFMKRKKAPPPDSTFIPLNFELKSGQEVKFKIQSPSGTKELPFGKINLFANNFNMGFLTIEEIEFTSKGYIFSGNPQIPLSKLQDRDVALFIGNEKIFTCTIIQEGLLLSPPAGVSYKVIRPFPSGYINPKQLKDIGHLTMDLETPDGTNYSIPFARYVKRSVKLKRTDDKLTHLKHSQH